MKKDSVLKIAIVVLVLVGVVYISLPFFIPEVDYVSEKELTRNLENAKNGDADAMWYLAKRYHLHLDADSALYWAKAAYAAGNKEVSKYFWDVDKGKEKDKLIILDSRDNEGLFKDKDYFYRTYDMGTYYGVPVDMSYLRKWAEKGLPSAIEMYTAYSYALSADPPIEKDAWKILINGAKKGVAKSQYLVRRIYEENGYPETIDWLYLTANNRKSCTDRSDSQRMLARMYLKGDTIYNIKPNVPLAMYWMKRIIETSNEGDDVECAKYNYQQCVKKGYIAAKEDKTPYNKNPSGKYIWNKDKKTNEPITDIDDYLDTLYNAAEEQDLSELEIIPDCPAAEIDDERRYEL